MGQGVARANYDRLAGSAKKDRGLPSDQTSKVPIGGWLIFPAIGTHIAPFYAAYASVQDVQSLSQLPDGVPPEITAFVALDAVCAALLAIGWFVAILLFHKRNKRFP